MNFSIPLVLSIAAALPAPSLVGADLAVYRGFQLGMPVSEAAKQLQLEPSAVQLVSSRPERIEQLNWHLNWAPRSARTTGPFSELVFRFYNGALFEMAISYDRDQTRGLTNEDMVEAVSGIYGTPVPPKSEEVSFGSGLIRSQLKVIARWENPETQVSLVHLSYGPGFGIVISSLAIKIKAEQAIVESDRLDRAESPLRESALRAKQLAEEQVADEQARSLNKVRFRP